MNRHGLWWRGAALLTVLVIMAVLWSGSRQWLLRDDGGEWQTVNREMKQLLQPSAKVQDGTEEAAPKAGSLTAAASSPVSASSPATAAPAAASPTAASPAAVVPPHLIDINRASVSRLEELPGIGPGKAKAIAEYRERNGPFRKPEELMKVKGIGPKTYEALKDRIAVSP